MSEVSENLSVTGQIIDSAPTPCLGCETIFAKSSVLAIRVLEGQVTIEEVQQELQIDLADNCRGRIARLASWGTTKYVCTYNVPLGPNWFKS